MHVDGDGPTALILTRQKVPVLAATAERAPEGVPRGAYTLVDESGDDLDLVLARHRFRGVGVRRGRSTLAAEGISVPRRVDAVVGPLRRAVRRLPRARCCRRASRRSRSRPASTFGWERYADDVVGIDHFGASAPGAEVLAEFGFTPENVAAHGPHALLENGDRVMTSAIARLNDFGQSPWYDNLARPLLTGGGLAELVARRRDPRGHVEPDHPRQGDRRR